MVASEAQRTRSKGRASQGKEGWRCAMPCRPRTRSRGGSEKSALRREARAAAGEGQRERGREQVQLRTRAQPRAQEGGPGWRAARGYPRPRAEEKAAKRGGRPPPASHRSLCSPPRDLGTGPLASAQPVSLSAHCRGRAAAAAAPPTRPTHPLTPPRRRRHPAPALETTRIVDSPARSSVPPLLLLPPLHPPAWGMAEDKPGSSTVRKKAPSRQAHACPVVRALSSSSTPHHLPRALTLR